VDERYLDEGVKISDFSDASTLNVLLADIINVAIKP
jgi:hypothetical protein